MTPCRSIVRPVTRRNRRRVGYARRSVARSSPRSGSSLPTRASQTSVNGGIRSDSQDRPDSASSCSVRRFVRATGTRSSRLGLGHAGEHEPGDAGALGAPDQLGVAGVDRVGDCRRGWIGATALAVATTAETPSSAASRVSGRPQVGDARARRRWRPGRRRTQGRGPSPGLARPVGAYAGARRGCPTCPVAPTTRITVPPWHRCPALPSTAAHSVHSFRRRLVRGRRRRGDGRVRAPPPTSSAPTASASPSPT